MGGGYKFSLYDMSLNILPICVISSALFLAQLICVALAPLFGFNALDVWIDYGIKIGISVAVFYVLNVLAGTVVLIAEHKRLKNVKAGVLIGALLVWPIFIFLSIPLEIACLFVKVGWKQIPHDDKTTFEQVNDGDAPTEEIICAEVACEETALTENQNAEEISHLDVDDTSLLDGAE